MADQLLTVAEAQTALSISRPTLYRLMASGEIHSVKLGRSRRIPQSSLDDFIAALKEADSGLDPSYGGKQ